MSMLTYNNLIRSLVSRVGIATSYSIRFPTTAAITTCTSTATQKNFNYSGGRNFSGKEPQGVIYLNLRRYSSQHSLSRSRSRHSTTPTPGTKKLRSSTFMTHTHFHTSTSNSNLNSNSTQSDILDHITPEKSLLQLSPHTLHSSTRTRSTIATTTPSQTELELDDEEQKDLIWNSAPAFPNVTFNFAPYVNDSYTLKKLIDLGVDLSQLEKQKKSTKFILRLDFNQDVAPYIRFLCDCGVPLDKLGAYFTRNPFILKENLENLEKRIEYLRSKKFTEEDIIRIINSEPKWLSFKVTEIDSRLGFFQKFFRLTGNEVRSLATVGPKLITSKIDRVQFVTFKFKEEMGFEPKEIVQLLLSHPRLWLEHPEDMWNRFNYLHNELKFSHEELVKSRLLLQRQSRLRSRFGFLIKLGKNQFNPEKPNFISFESICSFDDSHFATEVAKSSVIEFNNYLKTL